MKKLVFIFFATALLCSCTTNSKIEQEEQQIEKPLRLSGTFRIVIIDENDNDRLNPESPSYWGDDYVNGIKLFIMHKNKKLLYKHLATRFVDEYHVNDSTIIPQAIHLSLTENLCYYSISCDAGDINRNEDGGMITCSWISYPDGSEDEVRAEWIDRIPNEQYVNKIWINNELASQRLYDSVPGSIPSEQHFFYFICLYLHQLYS